MNIFNRAAKLDGYKDWAEFCRWDVGDAIYRENSFLPGLFVMWYGAVILLRIAGLPLRLLWVAAVSRIRGAKVLGRKEP
jgi:hypothetical protein